MPTIETDDLKIAYAEHGPADGDAVLLLHGWPDDASTWDGVAPALAASGHRVIVPSLRGFGATRFTSGQAPRTANSGILAMDAIALLDALGVGHFSVAGHDWGSNMAEALAVGWPARVERMAMLSSPPRLGGMATPPFPQAQRYWYHWFMATPRGAAAVRADPHGFAHIMWENWAPQGWFDEATFETVARSFDNPDWVDVTLHSYRWRWGNAEPDPRGAGLDDKVRETKTLSVPTIYVQGDADGVSPPDAPKKVPDKFTGPIEIVELPGVGHFPQREAPQAIADILVSFFAGVKRSP